MAFGFDTNDTTCSAGCAPGPNEQPRRLNVSFCTMSDLGQTLVHVAGVGLRSASACRVAHNRCAHHITVNNVPFSRFCIH